LAKAFYSVNHEILASKLFYSGIQGVNSQRLEPFVINRKQKFEIILQNQQQESSSN
jgi:hypothetical protein